MTNCPEYILIVRSAKYDKFNLKKESYEIVSKLRTLSIVTVA